MAIETENTNQKLFNPLEKILNQILVLKSVIKNNCVKYKKLSKL